jgi:hypothetical protein
MSALSAIAPKNIDAIDALYESDTFYRMSLIRCLIGQTDKKALSFVFHGDKRQGSIVAMGCRPCTFEMQNTCGIESVGRGIEGSVPSRKGRGY